MFRTIKAVLLVSMTSLFLLTSCGDSDPIDPSVDFREQWVGTYEGGKSNSSFDDTIFTTPIEFEILIDEDSEDGLIINGIQIPISTDGTFGPGFVNNGDTNYEVVFISDEVRIKFFTEIINGLGFPCFIKATLIN